MPQEKAYSIYQLHTILQFKKRICIYAYLEKVLINLSKNT